MEKRRTAIITGANKGIGFGIAKKLCSPRYAYKVILTSRNVKRGEAAMAEILERYPESKERLFYYRLDITDNQSIIDFHQNLKYQHRSVDLIVNNAGVGANRDLWKDTKPSEIMKTIIDTNYRGHINFISFMIPLMSFDAKIINIGSSTGKLGIYKEDWEL